MERCTNCHSSESVLCLYYLFVFSIAVFNIKHVAISRNRPRMISTREKWHKYCAVRLAKAIRADHDSSCYRSTRSVLDSRRVLHTGIWCRRPAYRSHRIAAMHRAERSLVRFVNRIWSRRVRGEIISDITAASRSGPTWFQTTPTIHTLHPAKLKIFVWFNLKSINLVHVHVVLWSTCNRDVRRHVRRIRVRRRNAVYVRSMERRWGLIASFFVW